MGEVLTNVIPLSSNTSSLQSFIFTDKDKLNVLNVNMSYQEMCQQIHNSMANISYFIHDYESLEQPNGNVFPLHSMKCISDNPTIDPPSELQKSRPIVVNELTHDAITNNLILTQLYITLSHEYCPTQCHDCDLPLWDENRDPRRTLYLQEWAINKPITAGWNITTSSYSYQQIINSVEVYIYGLKPRHQVQITIYDYSADKIVSQSSKHEGKPNVNKYDIDLPIKTNNKYNFLRPNHQYAINIRLHNVTTNDAKSIQIVLQNITDIYYSPTSYDHLTDINGLLFIYSQHFNFDLAHNAVSLFTPFGSICIICIGQNDDILPLPPSTATPSNSPTTADPTATPSMSPSTEPTPLPTAMPTNHPTDDPSPSPTLQPTSDPTIEPTMDPTIEPTQSTTNTPTTEPSAIPTIEPTPSTTKVPTPSPIPVPTNKPTPFPIPITTESPSPTPTISPTRRPTPECLPRDADPFCGTVCNEDADESTEWDIEFDSYSYNHITDVTTFNYRASTSQLPPAQWCRTTNRNTQTMTIIFLYISSCCEPPHYDHLKNITHTRLEHETVNPTSEIPLFGINGNHWIYHPFKLNRGESSEFQLELSGEYLITDGSYVASHKSWFDGSRPDYRCALGNIFVPDVCYMETKTPTYQPTKGPTKPAPLVPTVSPTPEPTDMPTVNPTKSPTVPTVPINVTECPVLGWPDLQDDCEQYCLNTTNVEWDMAHISSLYNQLTDTTTIAWSVTIENNHWEVDNWCFPVWFGGGFNYPEQLERLLIRFNRCCIDKIQEYQLEQMIERVSDEGDFSIITDDDDYVTGIQWDDINLKKGKTSMFFVTWKGNMTLIDGDYWFFGSNKHSRCASNNVDVPDICYSLDLNEYEFKEVTADPNEDFDWFLQWQLALAAIDVDADN